VTLAVTLGVAEPFPDCAEPRVVLFRSLPDELEERVRVDLVGAAGPPFPLGVAGVLPLADGAALALASPELSLRHRELEQRWHDHLTEADRRPLRAHVVIRRGLPPAEARALFTVRRRGFRPHEVTAESFLLWRTDPTGWTELAHVPFAGRC